MAQPRHKASRPIIDPAVISGWSERRARLDALLDEDPSGEWAWLWSVRLRVLDYLIDQHGGTTHAETDSSEPIARRPDQPPAENTSPYDRPPIRMASRSDSPLKQAHLDRLKSLQETNDKRRAIAKPIPPTPPPNTPVFIRLPAAPRMPVRRPPEHRRLSTIEKVSNATALAHMLGDEGNVLRTTYPDDLPEEM